MAVQNGAFTRTNGFAQNPGDERILPRFWVNSIQDPVASEREGRPIFFDREEVELITPGNPYNIPNEIVNDSHRERWAKQYQAFKAGTEISADGTPIEQWALLKRSQVLELKALNLTTVEQIAEMNDLATQRFMGGQRMRALAKAFLDEAEAGAALARSTAENERSAATIADLTRKVDELSTLLNSVHSQMQDMKNAPSPIATYVPGMADPIEQAKGPAQPVATSSLDSLPAPRRRGRPPGSVNKVA